jgi:hypothetical protein
MTPPDAIRHRQYALQLWQYGIGKVTYVRLKLSFDYWQSAYYH